MDASSQCPLLSQNNTGPIHLFRPDGHEPSGPPTPRTHNNAPTATAQRNKFRCTLRPGRKPPRSHWSWPPRPHRQRNLPPNDGGRSHCVAAPAAATGPKPEGWGFSAPPSLPPSHASSGTPGVPEARPGSSCRTRAGGACRSGGPALWSHAGLCFVPGGRAAVCAGLRPGAYGTLNQRLCPMVWSRSRTAPFGRELKKCRMGRAAGGRGGRTRTRKRHRQEHRPQRPTERNIRREERGTVQGPVKEQQPDGMSHGGGGADTGIMWSGAAGCRQNGLGPKASPLPSRRPAARPHAPYLRCLPEQPKKAAKPKPAAPRPAPKKATAAFSAATRPSGAYSFGANPFGAGGGFGVFQSTEPQRKVHKHPYRWQYYDDKRPTKLTGPNNVGWHDYDVSGSGVTLQDPDPHSRPVRRVQVFFFLGLLGWCGCASDMHFGGVFGGWMGCCSVAAAGPRRLQGHAMHSGF